MIMPSFPTCMPWTLHLWQYCLLGIVAEHCSCCWIAIHSVRLLVDVLSTVHDCFNANTMAATSLLSRPFFYSTFLHLGTKLSIFLHTECVMGAFLCKTFCCRPLWRQILWNLLEILIALFTPFIECAHLNTDCFPFILSMFSCTFWTPSVSYLFCFSILSLVRCTSTLVWACGHAMQTRELWR